MSNVDTEFRKKAGQWSLAHLNMLDATPPEVIEAAAAAGFGFAGLRLIPTMPGEAPHPMQNNSAMLRRTRQLMADTGTRVLDIEALWLRPDSDPREHLQAFEAAGLLGARYVQAISADPQESRVADTLAAFAEAALPFGLSMSFEFMLISQIKTLDAALRIVQATGMRNVQLTIDALHCFRCNVPMQAIAALDPARIGLVQICDAPARAPADAQGLVQEARFDRRLPGEGELPLADWLSALPGAHVLAIEAPQKADPAAPRRPTPTERAQVLRDGLARYFQHMPAAEPFPTQP